MDADAREPVGPFARSLQMSSARGGRVSRAPGARP